jgi:hypothetical protein
LVTGFKFDDFATGLEYQSNSRISGSASFSWRRDDDYINVNQFNRKSNALTQHYLLRFQKIASLSGSFAFTHRERTYTDPTVEDSKTDLAEMLLNFSPFKRAIFGNFNYQISNTATSKKERIYIKVSEGDGNYRFDPDLNEYVNDPLGDHIMRILTTDEFIPVIELKSSARVRLEPSRLFQKSTSALTDLINVFSAESYLAVEERSQEEKVWDIYLFKLSKFQQPNTTIFGNMHLRQDFYLFEHDRDFSLRYRYQSRDEKNNQYLEGGQDRLERENSVRVLARITDDLSSKTEITQKRTLRSFNYSGRQDRDIYANSASMDISFRPVPPLELAMENRFSLEEDRAFEQPTKVRAFAIAPRLTYSLRGKGRMRAEMEWSYVDSDPSDRIIPYEMASGRSLGQSMRWDVRFDYKISNTINATFSYTGRNEPERNRTIHTGRAQVTAAFR